MEGHYEKKYLASAGANQVVTASPALLHAIIIGKDVASSIVEVSDHASDGDGDVQIYLDGSNLSTLNAAGGIIVDAVFNKGICCDITSQTNCTFIFRNVGLNT